MVYNWLLMSLLEVKPTCLSNSEITFSLTTSGLVILYFGKKLVAVALVVVSGNKDFVLPLKLL